MRKGISDNPIWTKHNLTKKNEQLKSQWGTIDKWKPQSLYIEFTGWVKINNKSLDCCKELRQLRKRLKQFTYFNIDNKIFNKDSNLVVIDYPEPKDKYDSCFMTISINFYQRGLLSIEESLLMNEVFKMKELVYGEVINSPTLNFLTNKPKKH
tara:strand:+ start:4391 stop:4849 length:459 start_codon:yes stop_codon:yes gene_type:complete